MPEKICPRCSSPIPDSSDESDTQGSPSAAECPRCLLKPAWDKPQGVAITLGPGQSFVPPSIEELSEHLVGYEIEAKIGQGGMGAVYLGRQKSLDRKVAIKILPPQIAERSGFRDRFAREGRALAKLNHPNIVAVYDFGEAGPYAMLVMELVEGANLREVLAQGRLTPREALEIIPQLCDALAYAHDEGVVHRDIKPENLLFDARGRLKITDFGLAKLVSTKSDPSGDSPENARPEDPTASVVGTLHYMAPEQLENPKSVDHRADIYALGVVFYEMLTGELPIGRFEPPSAIASEHNGTVDKHRVSIDIKIDEVVLRALEKHPEKRYGSASELRQDIDTIDQADEVRSESDNVHVQRIREGVHRAGETAAEYATKAYDAGTEFASNAKQRWVKDYFDVTSIVAAAVFLGGIGLAWLMFLEPRGEPWGIFIFVVSSFATILLSRLGLRANEQSEHRRDNVVYHFILGSLYLIAVAVFVLAPIITSCIAWVEIFGDVREPGDAGWLRDWINITATAVIATTVTWLGMLGFHVVFPAVFTFVFKPFVKPLKARNAVILGALLVTLLFGGWFALVQLPYRSYQEGDAVSRDLWNELSPRDMSMAQREASRMRQRDSK